MLRDLLFVCSVLNCTECRCRCSALAVANLFYKKEARFNLFIDLFLNHRSGSRSFGLVKVINVISPQIKHHTVIQDGIKRN